MVVDELMTSGSTMIGARFLERSARVQGRAARWWESGGIPVGMWWECGGNPVGSWSWAHEMRRSWELNPQFWGPDPKNTPQVPVHDGLGSCFGLHLWGLAIDSFHEGAPLGGIEKQ